MQMLKEHVAEEQLLDLSAGMLVDVGRTTTFRESAVVEPPVARRRVPALLPQTDSSEAVRTYCENVSTLLQGQFVEIPAAPGDFEREFKRVVRESDLVLVNLPKQSILERLLFGRVGQRAVCRASTTVLLVQAPRWPIRKVLLVLRIHPQESLAIDWAATIIRLSGAELIIQPVLPEQPLMYGPGSRLQISIDSLLTLGTPCGEQLRSFLDQLKERQVQGTLRVRQGDPVWQVCTEIEAGDHDLVIIGAEPHGRLRRWFAWDYVNELISMINLPILIVGSGQASRRGAHNGEPVREVFHDR